MGRITNFLLSRDHLGHRVALKYKGSDMHPSKLGAFLSIAIKVITATYLILKIINLVGMTDPTLTVY